MSLTRDWKKYLADRYLESASGCWEWQRGKTPKGYGKLMFQGRMKYAHRLAYEVFVGPIPTNVHVCHRCDNPSCINPAHLFLGTNADNMADKVAKGRSTQGTRHPSAKLTEEQVLTIRHATGTQQEIASAFGVAKKTVARIRNKEAWRHL